MAKNAVQLPCYREEFLLDENLLFLNHGSLGSVARPVLEKYHAWHYRLERNPIQFLDREIGPLLFAARERIATYLNAPVRSIVFIENVSVGVNQIVASLDLRSGDEIVITNLEYGAYRRIWEALEARGVKLQIAVLETPFGSPEELAAPVLELLSSSTRLVFVSHLTSATALILPVEKICAEARRRGIPTLVDGAHAVGQLDLDLTAIDPDFYLGNFHKWIGAPRGSAFLYASAAYRESVKPLTVSWGSELRAATGDPFVDNATWTGTRDYAAYLTVPDALDYQKDRDWPAIRAACRSLARATEARFRTELDLPQLYKNPESAFAQMFALIIQVKSSQEFRDFLSREHNIELQGGSHAQLSLMRLAIQCHTPPDAMGRVLSIVKEMLSSGKF